MIVGVGMGRGSCGASHGKNVASRRIRRRPPGGAVDPLSVDEDCTDIPPVVEVVVYPRTLPL